jgi:hypothetical protein
LKLPHTKKTQPNAHNAHIHTKLAGKNWGNN